MRKSIKVCIILVTIIITFLGINLELSAVVSSRIEGVVTDKDTKQPIEGVNVFLYLEYRSYRWAATDSKGYYKFDNVSPNSLYHMQFRKKGYVSFLPKYYSDYIKREFFDIIYKTFFVKEGQIKHVRIELEKGGTLEGVISKKQASGITGLEKVTLILVRKKKSGEYFFDDTANEITVMGVKTNENGEFTFEGLEPCDDDPAAGDYSLELIVPGYNSAPIRGIKIKKYETLNLEHTVDMTVTNGIKGTIKINGEPPNMGGFVLHSLAPDEQGVYRVFTGSLDENGCYYYYGLLPGRYKLAVSLYYSDDNKEILDKKILKIIEGQTQVWNFNFEGEE
ncbi:MAG: carboxypeptidase regulatory-like domain-containing protein [bacterium]|nr:carboxypeptidase regulatory-like domain-containing protein [bacterium]